MRARPICSLTPAVYLDYRGINRPRVADCGSEKLTDRQTDRQTRDADKWKNINMWRQAEKSKEASSSEFIYRLGCKK